jgi:hypothetical protein
MIEGSVLEQRIEALEAAAAEHELGPRPNGHARHEVRQ